MADDQQSSNKTERELTQASENIWYALATIAGEPKNGSENEIIDKNRYYWNGYMRSMMVEGKYLNLLERDINYKDLPELTKNDLTKIYTTMSDRGFQTTKPLSGTIDFRDLEFPFVVFSKYVFPHFVRFENSRFSDMALFTYAYFAEYASFESVRFDSSVYFSNSNFKGRVNFKAIVSVNDFNLSNVSSKLIRFQGAHFKGLSFFKQSQFFEGVDFCRAKFDSECDFSGTISKNKILFRQTVFKEFPPKFFNAVVPENISWAGATFPSNKNFMEIQADQHKDAYERLSLMMDKLKKHHDQHMFFRLEMRARRQMETNLFMKQVNHAYELFSDYGYGFGRATLWWLGHIILGAGLLMPRKGLRFDFSVSGFVEGLQLFGTALVTSFSNAHGFLGLGRISLKDTIAEYQKMDLLIPYNVTATAQTIIGVFLLFFLILTARNRFRMG